MRILWGLAATSFGGYSERLTSHELADEVRPDECSIDDASAAPRDRAVDRRARLPGAQLHARRNETGDGVFFYHSSCEEPGIAGLAEVASEPYPDPTQFDRKSKYYDAASKRDTPLDAGRHQGGTKNPPRPACRNCASNLL